MPYKCSICGDDSKVFDNKRQARGHMKFKSGDGHGDAQSVPDDYESDLVEVDADDESDEVTDKGNAGSSDDRGGSEDTDDRSEDTPTSDDGGSDGRGTIAKLLDKDVRELLGGS